jgi:hypothetical protein
MKYSIKEHFKKPDKNPIKKPSKRGLSLTNINL